jgi:hypothetical protein
MSYARLSGTMSGNLDHSDLQRANLFPWATGPLAPTSSMEGATQPHLRQSSVERGGTQFTDDRQQGRQGNALQSGGDPSMDLEHRVRRRTRSGARRTGSESCQRLTPPGPTHATPRSPGSTHEHGLDSLGRGHAFEYEGPRPSPVAHPRRSAFGTKLDHAGHLSCPPAPTRPGRRPKSRCWPRPAPAGSGHQRRAAACSVALLTRAPVLSSVHSLSRSTTSAPAWACRGGDDLPLVARSAGGIRTCTLHSAPRLHPHRAVGTSPRQARLASDH